MICLSLGISLCNQILGSTLLSNASIIIINISKQNDSAKALAMDVQLEIETFNFLQV